MRQILNISSLLLTVAVFFAVSCAGNSKVVVSKSEIPDSEIQTKFLDAIQRNDVDSVRQFLRTGRIDMYRDVPGAGSRRPMPILLWAINENRSLSIITELVEYYTDPLDNIIDRDGNNAWYYATLRKNSAVQNLLRQKGIRTTNAENTQ
jgi:ankyrin repeat protein